MTAIVGIAATELPWHGNEPSKPLGDFSQELAKRHTPSHGDAKAPAGDEKAELHETTVHGDAKAPVGDEKAELHGTTVSEDPKSDVSLELFRVEMLDQVRAAPVDQLSEAMQPLDRATAQPVGVTEALLGARVFGWHALAQSYLSELAAFDGTPGGDKLPTEAHVSSTRTEPRVPEAASGNASGATGTPVTAGAPEALPTAGPAPEIEGAGGSVDAGASNLAAMASTDYWAERSLRFMRQPDGQSVAWLRDYRLDAGKADQVVQLVLQEARAKGFALDKIMLNGREAWSSRGQA